MKKSISRYAPFLIGVFVFSFPASILAQTNNSYVFTSTTQMFLEDVNFSAGTQISLSVPTTPTNTPSSKWSVQLELSAYNQNTGWAAGPTLTNTSSGGCVSMTVPTWAASITTGGAAFEQVVGTPPLPLTMTIGSGCGSTTTAASSTSTTSSSTIVPVTLNLQVNWSDGTTVGADLAISSVSGTSYLASTALSNGAYTGTVNLDYSQQLKVTLSYPDPNVANQVDSLVMTEPAANPQMTLAMLMALDIEQVQIVVSKTTGQFSSFSVVPR